MDRTSNSPNIYILTGAKQYSERRINILRMLGKNIVPVFQPGTERWPPCGIKIILVSMLKQVSLSARQRNATQMAFASGPIVACRSTGTNHATDVVANKMPARLTWCIIYGQKETLRGFVFKILY